MPSRLYVRELPPVHRMELLTSVDPDLLRWIRVDAEKHEFDLKAGDAVVAALRWKSALGSMATVVTAEAKLTIKRTGFSTLGSQFGMPHRERTWPTSMPIPPEAPSYLAGGTTYDWHRTGLLVPGWHFRDRDLERRSSVSSPCARGCDWKAPSSRSPTRVASFRNYSSFCSSVYFIALAWLEDQAAAASSALLTAAVGP